MVGATVAGHEARGLRCVLGVRGATTSDGRGASGRRASLLTVKDGEARWEYRILWRYGALFLVVVGLLAMGFGASDLAGTAISLTLLPIGFVCLVAGVVLPRIEGKFTAGPSGLSAEIMAVHRLDQPRFVASAPALAAVNFDPLVDAEPPGADAEPARAQITLGDVWDALDAGGHALKFQGAGMGHAFLSSPDGRVLQIPNRGFWDHGIASAELVALLDSWEVRPVASGKYPAPPDLAREKLTPVHPVFVPPP